MMRNIFLFLAVSLRVGKCWAPRSLLNGLEMQRQKQEEEGGEGKGEKENKQSN